MSRTPATSEKDSTATTARLFMAMELSSVSWRLAFTDGAPERKPRYRTVGVRDVDGLRAAIAYTKEKLKLPADAAVLCCSEAGRDGFSVHRLLTSIGIESLVIDPASIEVNRKRRRAKTDRLDVGGLLARLVRHHRGDAGVWSVVRPPSEQDEDARRPHREHQALTKERTRLTNYAKALLAAHGVTLKRGLEAALRAIGSIRCWNGEPLPTNAAAELTRTAERLELVTKQLDDVHDALQARIDEPRTESDKKAARLAELRGVGPVISNVLVMEFFGWRDFRNRRQVGAAAGLTATPYDTGKSEREQGISKAGNRRVRRVAIEAALLWLRWQPKSALSQWYAERFGHGAARMKRVGVVAVARKLLVAFWRFLKDGVVPDGARLGAA